MAPVLKQSCCGCCSLEMGTFIIAILDLFGSVGGIITAAIALSETNLNKYNYRWFTGEEPAELYLNIGYLGFSIIQLIVSVLLMISVEKRRAAFAIPWLVEVLIVLLTSLAGFAFLMFNYLLNGISASILIWGTVFALSIGLHVYYWLIVFSFYQKVTQMEEDHRRQKEIEREWCSRKPLV